eukprot:3194564-Amphidinium_carterae.1
MPVNRATADRVPSSAFTSLASQISSPLCALFNRCLATSSVPLSYSGARIVPVWKRKGSALQCTSYRPISLLLLEAKLFARLCLKTLESQLHFHSLQFGSGPRCGIEYPQIAVVQMASLALSSRSASASLFVDVSAAFDSVPHPALWGAGANWDGTSAAIERSGYSPVSAEALALFLHQHPSLLAKVGIPPSLVELLR